MHKIALFFKNLGFKYRQKKKELKSRHWRPTFASIFTILMLIIAFLFWLYFIFSDHSTVTAEMTSILSIFMSLATLLLIGGLFDIILNKKGSRILVTALGGIMITAYAITMAIHVSHENLVANVALYVLAAIFMAAMTFFYLKKSIDGDAILPYKVSMVIVLILLLFCSFFTYSPLEAYSYFGNTGFWLMVIFTLFYFLLCCWTTYLNINSDFALPEKEKIEISKEKLEK